MTEHEAIDWLSRRTATISFGVSLFVPPHAVLAGAGLPIAEAAVAFDVNIVVVTVTAHRVIVGEGPTVAVATESVRNQWLQETGAVDALAAECSVPSEEVTCVFCGGPSARSRTVLTSGWRMIRSIECPDCGASSDVYPERIADARTAGAP